MQDEATRIRARTMAGRLGISAGLHMHRGTGRWAGPHSRAYQPTVAVQTPPRWRPSAPGWPTAPSPGGWRASPTAPRPLAVEETAGAYQDFVLSTYHAPAFSLGSPPRRQAARRTPASSTTTGRRAPRRPLHPLPAERQVAGDTYHATDRTKSRNLIDEGEFFGVQNGPRAICLYAPGRLSGCSSAKGTLIWTERDRVEEIWVGGRRVESLPAEVGPGDVVVVTSGAVHIAVRPLAVTDLHMGAPRRLAEMRGDLVLELYNYQGPEKRFWELGWPGAFYQGRPQCGFYLEVAARDAYPDGRAFGGRSPRGRSRNTDPLYLPRRGRTDRARRLCARRAVAGPRRGPDGLAGLERRRDECSACRCSRAPWPSRAARAARARRATLRTGPRRPGSTRILRAGAGWPATTGSARRRSRSRSPAAPWRSALGTGTVVWDGGRVTVEAVGLAGTPASPAGNTWGEAKSDHQGQRS